MGGQAIKIPLGGHKRVVLQGVSFQSLGGKGIQSFHVIDSRAVFQHLGRRAMLVCVKGLCPPEVGTGVPRRKRVEFLHV